MKSEQLKEVIEYIGSCIPLAIIVFGLIGNTISFLVFTFDEKMKSINSMIYLSFISITDTLSLFVWNLNHFLFPRFKIQIEFLSLFNCKLFVFLQYFSLQCSGLLLSMLTIDRYFTVAALPGNLISKFPFRTRRNSFIWSLLVIFVIFVLNVHIPILNGVTIENNVSKFDMYLFNTSMMFNDYFVCYLYPTTFKVFPYWEIVHLILYSAVPFLIMALFNSLLIYKSLNVCKKAAFASKNDGKKLKLTASLIITTIVFLLMTLPSSIAFGFFMNDLLLYEYGEIILHFLDHFSYLNRSSLLFTFYLTNENFKKGVKNLFRKVLPLKN
jgi:hypothetical protein